MILGVVRLAVNKRYVDPDALAGNRIGATLNPMALLLGTRSGLENTGSLGDAVASQTPKEIAAGPALDSE